MIEDDIIDPKRLMIIGNKCDLNDKRQVSYEDGQLLAKQYGCIFMETSAKEDINIKTAFDNLIESVIGQICNIENDRNKEQKCCNIL